MDALRTDPDAVAAYAAHCCPSIGRVVRVDRLTQGLLNFVWRVTGTSASVVVKVMAEFVASDPSIALDLRRVEVEAAALELLAADGRLGSVCESGVRTPRLLDHDLDRGVLILEDFGPIPDLAVWLDEADSSGAAAELGTKIGEFVGRLHLYSLDDATTPALVENPAAQRTRLDVQYRAIGELAGGAGLADAARLGRRAEALGRMLTRTGRVFIMGDLWPRSLLISGLSIGVIDWELAHWGWPAQDVAHLGAHLWMIEQRARDDLATDRVRRTRAGFLGGYRNSLGTRFDEVFGTTGLEQSEIHAGAEILARALGRFKTGSLYDRLSPESAVVKEAVEVAAGLIRGDPRVDIFDALRS